MTKVLRLNTYQIVKGLILTVVGALIQGSITALSGGTIATDYKKILIAGLIAGLSYIGTTLTQNTKGQYLKKETNEKK